MPLMSGYRLLRPLCSGEVTEAVRVVVVSGESFQMVREALRDGPSGPADFLPSPPHQRLWPTACVRPCPPDGPAATAGVLLVAGLT